jgi:hypothetical protein
MRRSRLLRISGNAPGQFSEVAIRKLSTPRIKGARSDCDLRKLRTIARAVMETIAS